MSYRYYFVVAGYLKLNPDLQKVVRLAGKDNSFFISCLPISSSSNPVGDSEVRARKLIWKKKLPDNQWVTVARQTYERVHVENSADGRSLDLVFRSIHPGDEADYACHADLDGQLLSKKFHLKVLEPISFDPSNEVQTVEEGTQRFILRCNVRGNPKPQISWNVQGNTIHGGEHPKYEVTNEGLIIYNVTLDDRGQYKCKATQFEEGITDFKDLVIQLVVQHAPIWIPDQREQFYGYISGTSVLTCQVEAEPLATFRWMDKHDKKLPMENITQEGNMSKLTLVVQHDDMFGRYSCIASNKMGTLSRILMLSEGAKPGVPHISVKSIKHNRAILHIEENKSELFLEIIGFQVEVKQKMDLWDNATIVNFEKNPIELYTIENLLPKTCYLIRARAQNLAGFSDSSNIIILETTDEKMVGELLGQGSDVNEAVTVVIDKRLSQMFVVSIVVSSSLARLACLL